MVVLKRIVVISTEHFFPGYRNKMRMEKSHKKRGCSQEISTYATSVTLRLLGRNDNIILAMGGLAQSLPLAIIKNRIK